MVATETGVKAVRCARPRGRWVPALVLSAIASAALAPAVRGATLPEDRADLMYHRYKGGGLTVDGPAVLVRQSMSDKVSVWGSYYVDAVTSASVDVMTTASPYEERRDEWSAGTDFVVDDTSMGFSYTKSDEDDYAARTARFGISQSFFGDLTTVGITYSRGWDTVMKRGDETFEKAVDHRTYRVDVSQVLTRSFVVSLNYEAVSDEGFLNNPYRSVRFADSSAGRGFSFERELYPHTRTSDALALRTKYYLPYRAALGAEYRHYQDTFGVVSNDVSIDYSHPLESGWLFEARYRYYKQDAADFYSDLFPRANAQNFLARDKELSTFDSHTLGLGVSYDFAKGRLPWVDSGRLSVQADFMRISYDDFRDVTRGGTAGAEPLYELDAVILRAFGAVFF